MELLAQLAEQLPARYVTPASPLVNTALNDAVARAVTYVNEHGADGLEDECRKWLADMAADLRQRMAQWKVD